MAEDAWSPERYERFRAERTRPFHDLLERTRRARPSGTRRALDLGCGTGQLTARLHAELGARFTLGLDDSANMLARARSEEPGYAGLHFVRASIEALPVRARFDVVFSNAALHWVDDHRGLLAGLRELLLPDGLLAVQVPANHGHASQLIAHALAGEEPFATALDGYVRRTPVLPSHAYEALLDELGFVDVEVEGHVYEHELPSTAALVTWMRGTTLTPYERRLTPDTYAHFLELYAARLAAALGTGPLPFPFQRILFLARRPSTT